MEALIWQQELSHIVNRPVFKRLAKAAISLQLRLFTSQWENPAALGSNDAGGGASEYVCEDDSYWLNYRVISNHLNTSQKHFTEYTPHVSTYLCLPFTQSGRCFFLSLLVHSGLLGRSKKPVAMWDCCIMIRDTSNLNRRCSIDLFTWNAKTAEC